MKNDYYILSAKTLEIVMRALDLNATHACEGDEWNDEDVILALDRLKAEIEKNERLTG